MARLFNPGVFVLKPSMNTYNGLLQMLSNVGSFDGREQGLLNTYFSNWQQGGLSHRLPCIYNCICRISEDTGFEFYTSRSAWIQFGGTVHVAHFAGRIKPWHKISAAKTCSQAAFRTLLNTDVNRRSVSRVAGMLAYWWSLFLILVRPHFSSDMYLGHVSLESLRKYENIQGLSNSYGSYQPVDTEKFSSNNHNNNDNNNTSYTPYYPSFHEQQRNQEIWWNQTVSHCPPASEFVQLPYHPEFHDTTWNYLHRKQRIDEDNRFVEHHQTCSEASVVPLQPQLNLSLSGKVYYREKDSSKNPNQEHYHLHHPHEEQQQGNNDTSHNHYHQHNHQEASHNQNCTEHYQLDHCDEHHDVHLDKPNDTHHENEDFRLNDKDTVVYNDCQCEKETQNFELKSSDKETLSPTPSSSVVTPMNLSTFEPMKTPKLKSFYSLTCSKCYQEMIMEQEISIHHSMTRKLNLDKELQVKPISRKYKRYTYEIPLKSKSKILRTYKKSTRKSSLNNNQKRMSKEVNYNTTSYETTLPIKVYNSREKKLFKSNILTTIYNSENALNHYFNITSSNHYEYTQGISHRNIILSSQFRGLDLALFNIQGYNQTINWDQKNIFYLNRMKFQSENQSYCTSLKALPISKRSYSVEDINEWKFSLRNSQINNNNNLSELKIKRLSLPSNYLNKNICSMVSSLKLDYLNSYQLKCRQKVKKRSSYKSSRTSRNISIDQCELLNPDNKINLFNESISHSRLPYKRNMPGIPGQLANINYGKNLCARHSEIEAASIERMYAWERGEIDYTGTDRFMNILNKLCTTLRFVGGEKNLPIGIDIIK
ncbi:unnamed protein product [Heterobilharzia americana]|nr:unnamed protein product [Heterobilharzia americana]